MRALWTSCVDWGLSADLMQKAVLAGAKTSLWAGGSHSPVSNPWLSCVGGHITQTLHWELHQFIVFTYPRRAHNTNTTITLTQEDLCLFPVHMLQIPTASCPHPRNSFPSFFCSRGGEGERETAFHKGQDKHHWLRSKDLEGERLKYGAHFVRHCLKTFQMGINENQ